MINSTDMSDLHLEDVEDYSSDYSSDYPAGFRAGEENIAAVGVPQEDYVPKRRTSQLVHLIRSNKWTSGLVAAMVVILIAIIAIAGGPGDQVAPNYAGATHQDPVTVDPDSLDPAISIPLMEKLLEVYTRKNLDASTLNESAGDSPQRKAFYWLATDKNLDELSHTQLLQRYVLAVFYYATNAVPNNYEDDPLPWVTAHLWMSESHACEWKGIVCNEQQHIAGIDLERNNLSGSIPLELAIIGGKLTSLDLTSNLIFMSGDMYDVFTGLTELETLLMDDNYMLYEFGLPAQFENLTNLKKMRLSYNLFSGKLETRHKVLAQMTKLTHLELESNFLSGTMPPVIGELSNLVYIYMRRNDLSFNLDFLKTGKLKDLFALWLDSNKVTGTIPTEMGLLTELASVSITNATLTGTIPSQLGNLQNLRRLWLYNNQLTGTIPAGLRKLTELEVLELHNNNLGGPMPQGICDVIGNSNYEFKTLTSDCKDSVSCDSSCCTDCY